MVDGLVIDLCRGNAMIRTSTRSELDATLASRSAFSIHRSPAGIAHETIRRSFDYYSSGLLSSHESGGDGADWPGRG